MDGAWEAWPTLPELVRQNIVRWVHERRRGIAILQDRLCGREKYSMDGFFGLEMTWEALHAHICSGVVDEADPKRVELMKELTRRGIALLKDREDIEQRINAGDPESQQLFEWTTDWEHIESILKAEPMTGLELLSHVASQPQRVGQAAIREPINSAPNTEDARH